MTEIWGPSPAGAGVEAARRRLERADLDLTEETAQRGLDLAETALRNSAPAAPAPAPAPATEFFVEQVVVAAAMREVYKEAPLRPVEVEAFLGVARWFFNSLWHEHP